MFNLRDLIPCIVLSCSISPLNAETQDQLIFLDGFERSELAIKEINDAAERIGQDIKNGDLDPTRENLKARAEQELESWGESMGGDRFSSN